MNFKSLVNSILVIKLELNSFASFVSAIPSFRRGDRRRAFGLVVTFLAILELLKESLIEFIQTTAFAPIYLKSK